MVSPKSVPRTIYSAIGVSPLPQMVFPIKTLAYAVDAFSMHPKAHP